MAKEEEGLEDYELFVVCARCGREITFYAENEQEAIRAMRHAGWAYDQHPLAHHLCSDCLEEVVIRGTE